jgi:hypothetical protein
MKKIVQPEKYGEVLARWRGAHAQIWMYHVSHKRIMISLSRKGDSESAYVMAAGCRRISGPFAWAPSEIQFLQRKTEEADQAGTVIVDLESKFELICTDVAIYEGPSDIPADSFSGFLSEQESPT